MEFNLNETIDILQRTPKVLRHLLGNISHDWTDNNEGPETWSPYDVVGHLIHGEQTDWIPRAQIILEAADKNFIPFDRFAQFDNSKDKTLYQLLNQFEVIRNQNIATLKAMNLTDEQLELKGIHPEFREVTLQQLLATWAVHDLGHIGQITRVMAKQYKEEVGPWKNYLGVLSR
jgi:uncharacterized damage-inducible protein DinB